MMERDEIDPKANAGRDHGLDRRDLLLGGASVLALFGTAAAGPGSERAEQAQAGSVTTEAAGKPNIIMIMGDDIGWFNIGAYHRGMMAGRTPNLDKLATEGLMFTDYYAEASCTAGRANFITGQLPSEPGSPRSARRAPRSACPRKPRPSRRR
jgi:Sulfatase